MDEKLKEMVIRVISEIIDHRWEANISSDESPNVSGFRITILPKPDVDVKIMLKANIGQATLDAPLDLFFDPAGNPKPFKGNAKPYSKNNREKKGRHKISYGVDKFNSVGSDIELLIQ